MAILRDTRTHLGHLPATGDKQLAVKWVSNKKALQKCQAVAGGQGLLNSLWCVECLLNQCGLIRLPSLRLQHQAHHLQTCTAHRYALASSMALI